MSKYYSSSIAFGADQTKTEKVVVSPTKIGDVTTDAVSGALTVDEVPTLDSLNPVSSDGVARAVIQAGAELPTRGSSDTGKVLTVANSDGDLEWDEPAGGLPDMTGQDGKILGAVDNSGTMEAQWISKPVSNVTTTMGSFTVGVNGSGVPVSVDYTNGTISRQSMGLNYSAGGSIFMNGSVPALKFNLGEGVTVDGNAWGNPLFVVPTTVSITLPSGVSFYEGSSGLCFAQLSEFGDQTIVSSMGNPYSWASTSPITVTTVGDVSTVTLTAGTYEFVKKWNPNINQDTLVFNLRFTGTLTSEMQTSIENALSGCTVKNNNSGQGFAIITGYSIKPAVIANLSPSQANKFLQLSNTGTYTQWANVFPTYDTTTDAGKVLAVGSSGVEWINSVPIEVVASLPASPTAGVLYIVTGA